MISSSHAKKEDAKHFRKDVNKSPVRLSCGKKPLVKHRFYLDVKNRATANKLETKIKDLGGVIELFLVKEVTHVVTDREEWGTSKGGGTIPKTPQLAPNEPRSNDSPNRFEFTPTRGRPKTRADAMLEKARRTPTAVTKDPLEEAKTWGITIWTIEKAFAWLEKVTISIKVSAKKTNHKVFELKAPYIKFEAFDRQTRPIFQEIANWPSLNIQGSDGDPGVTCRSLAERNMTRKTRSNHPRVDNALQPGYCEVCRVEYPRLDEHLQSENHLNFVKDNSNFIQLDNLIGDTTNIETFIKINDLPKSAKSFNGIIARNKMPRTRTISLCDKIKNSPLSPTGSDSGHRLRSRRYISMTNNYLGSTADDDGQPIKPEGAREIRELRSSTRQLLKLVEHEAKDTWDSGRPKRSCIKQKRVSSDERLVVDNRTYYKVEVLPNKLRSSGINIKEIETTKKIQTPVAERNVELDKTLIVKFKRMRTSELKQLNNEAENFLFPRKDESSSDEDIDDNGPDTTVSVREGDSTLLLSSEPEESHKKIKQEIKQEDDASMDSNWSDNSSVKKRRRLTHAEAFILDNQKYYKFETPGSRLRYQGSYLSPIAPSKSPRHNGEYLKTFDKQIKKEKHHSKEIASKENNTTKEKPPKEKVNAKEKPKVNAKDKVKCNVKDKTTHSKEVVYTKLNINDLQFSFERVPHSEPWYQTFNRQDQGKEFYASLNESGYWKPFLLPYQMDPLPPLDPRVCVKAYQQVKRQFLETPSASTSAGCSTPDLQEECSKTSEDSDMTIETRNDEEVSALDIDEDKSSKCGKKRKGTAVGKNPRKSPRQHASTLAILSSLIHQRKRRSDLNKSKNSELDTSKQNLPAIPEVLEKNVYESDYELLAKKLDDMLLHSFEDFNHLELSFDEDPSINLSCKLNAIEILHEYDKVRDGEEDMDTKSAVEETLICKKPGRKKKKKNNRTGWPNKNRRRKEVVKDVDALSIQPESDDNCDEINSNTTEINRTVSKIKNNSVYNIDQSNTQLNVNSSLNNIQSTNIVTENSCSATKQDRVITVHERRSVDDKVDRVVDLDKWENAEKVLSAKLTNNEINNDIIQFQPYVRVQKMDGGTSVKFGGNRRLRSSSSPHRTVKRARRMPGSPKSPRMLRKPRGRWYRER